MAHEEFEVDFRGSFPAMAVMAEWPRLERDDPLVWPSVWRRPPIPSPLAQYFDSRSDVYTREELVLPGNSSARESGSPLRPGFGIAFQMVDITYAMYDIMAEREVKMPHVSDPFGEDAETYPPTYSRQDALVRQEPEIRMFGTNAAGNSVCARYRGFLPYLFIRLSSCSNGVQVEQHAEEIERCVKDRLQRYMNKSKKDQECLRMASMHVEVYRFLLQRVADEFQKLLAEFGLEENMVDHEDVDKTVRPWIRILSSNVCTLQEFLDDVLSHSAIGDRSRACCPHWSRVDPTLVDTIFRAQPEARERRRRQRRSSSSTVTPEPICSFLVYEKTFSKTRNSRGSGVTVPVVLCTPCREAMELVELVLQSSWQVNHLLINQHVKDEVNTTQDYVSDVEKCMDELCTKLLSDVILPITCFESNTPTKYDVAWSHDDDDDIAWADRDDIFIRNHISEVRFENHHQSMMACEERETAKEKPFLRVELFSPRDCPAIRTAVQYAGLLIHVPAKSSATEGQAHTSWVATYESNIPFVLRFSVDYNISGMGWVYTGPGAWTPVPVWHPDRKSKCQIEVLIDRWDPRSCRDCEDEEASPLSEGPRPDEIITGKNWTQMAPLVWMFFDDEMAGQNPNKMPRASNVGDLFTQSGVLLYRQNEKDPFEACIFSLGGSEPLLRRVNRREEISPEERALYARAKVFTFGSECDLLLAWRRMIEIVCPDFLCGYNSVDFDLPYMVRRSTTGVAVGQDTHVAFRRLSKVIEHEYERKDGSGSYWRGLTEIRKERFQSKAFGLRENDKAGTVGIPQFDVLRVIKQNEDKRSYKLDKVAREELSMHKVPLPYTEITPKATSCYDVMRSLINRYCLWDAILPKLIAVDNKTYDIIYTEMARITGVTMDHLLGKGQRIKITTRILKTARRARLNEGDIVRKICPSPKESPYSTEGCISFLLPYQRPTPLDVNPSFYDTENILEGEDDDDEHMKRGAQYSGATVLEANRGYYKDPTPTLDFSSLYPSIMMAFNYCITTYLGTAEDAEGRGLTRAWDLRKDKDYRFEPFSQMPDGDFVVAPNGAAFITRKHRVGLLCVDLGEVLAARGERKKMMAKYDKGSVERAAHNGAQLGLKVTANSIYGYTAGCNIAVSEAVTSTGRFLLEYTRDLVYERGQCEPRYANEQLYGDSVTKDTPLLIRNTLAGRISWERIDSLVPAECEYVRKGRATSKEQAVLYKSRHEVWTDSGWSRVKKVIRHRAKKNIYRVLTHTSVVDVTEDHSLLDRNGNVLSPADIRVGSRLLHHAPSISSLLRGEGARETPPFSVKEAYTMGQRFANGQRQKRVPPALLMAPSQYVRAFLNGYCACDIRPKTRVRQRGKLGAAGLIFLAQRVGWCASIDVSQREEEDFIITLTRGPQETAAADKVRGVFLLRKGTATDEYVYDLETENQHFHVGPGNLVVHNTDSIMFRLFNVPKLPGQVDRYDLLEAAKIGVELAKWITELYQAFGLFCINLEFEKVYETWLLKSKKHYAVYKHLFDVKTGELTASLSSSGLESVRRDVTLFTKELFGRVIEKTIQYRDLDGAIRLVQKMFTELKEGRVPMEKLIITGGFNKRADQYKNPVPHIEAVRKQMEDDPNNAPTVGSRVDWVIAMLSEDPQENAKAKVYKKAVMPEYLKAHKMKLDFEGYVVKCAKPFCRFFAPALAPKMNAAEGQTYVMRRVFQDYFRDRDEMKKRKQSALINAFARGIVSRQRAGTTKKQKRHPSGPNRHHHDDGISLNVAGKQRMCTDSDDSSEGPAGLERALSLVDPSRARFHKKVRRGPSQIREECGTFSSGRMTTTVATFDDWMFAAGTTKKGTNYRVAHITGGDDGGDADT